jgi:hypothetical protein
VKAPTPADVQARDFFRQRLGWWDPTDEQRSKDRKALSPGDAKAEELHKEEQTVLCTRLNLLVDLALDERGLMDRTQMCALPLPILQVERRPRCSSLPGGCAWR